MSGTVTWFALVSGTVRMGFSQEGWNGAARAVLRVAAAGVAGVLLWGCATTGTLSADTPAAAKEAAVAGRAQARWDALIKGDLPAGVRVLRAPVPVT